MSLYKSYYNTIQKAMTQGKMNESYSSFDGLTAKRMMYSELKSEIPENELLPELADLASQLGIVPNFNQSTGLHPHFESLKTSGDMEYHYIVSVFIDIKGSTNLFKKYDPSIVAAIQNTIQKAAIHTCLVFGGYIHRLHGDGLFVYFGGKGIDKKIAVQRAMQSTSLFTYFVKNDLKELFEEQGIERINTRIGIDLGHDDDVLWLLAGIGEISEVTTCSLHTSLASKMQTYAETNGIVVGDHIKDQVPLLNQFSSPVCNRTNNPNDRYIFEIPENNFRYTQHDFDWFNYLKTLPFIATAIDGKLAFKATNPVVYNNRSVQNLIPIAEKSKPYFNF